ncbi:hypothetical protein ACT17S_07235 [Glutamicibacter mysorens]
MATVIGRYVIIGNVRGPRGLKGDPGDPLNQAGWDYMKANFDALDGSDARAPIFGGRDFGVNHVHSDSQGYQTWLGSRDTDGGPTDYAEFHLRNRLGIHDSDGQFIGLTDSAFFYSELRVDKNTLQVPAEVLNAWGQRGGWGAGGGSGLAKGDRIIDSNGDLQIAFPDVNSIPVWGSSTMQLSGPFFEAAFADTGATVHGEGRSAERVEHTAARIGSYPALLTVTGGSIPASGSVVVTASNMETMAALKPFTGWLNGVHGTLSSTSTEMTFARTTAGSAVSVAADTPFISELGQAYRNGVPFLNIGKNSLRTVGSSAKVIEYTDNTIKWFSPMIKRVLVIGQFVDSDQTPGGLQDVEVTAVNDYQRAKYGDWFFDLRAYLTSSQVWADTGITPTSTDLQQQADGLKPDSLSVDAAHLNSTANTAFTTAARAHVNNLGWY